MDYILNYCRENIDRFSKMTDSEIYDWMCKNFYEKDCEMIRRCSFIIFKESRKIKN